MRPGVLLSLGIGFVSSFLGIGGGVIHVPVMSPVLGLPVHVATATSHFVLAVMSGAATLTHLAEGSYRAGDGLRRSRSPSRSGSSSAPNSAPVSHSG